MHNIIMVWSRSDDSLNTSTYIMLILQLYVCTLNSPQDEGGDGGSDGGGNDDSGDPDAFRFYPTEFEPHIPPDIEHRAKEALEEILSEPEESSPSCLSACCAAIQPRRLPGDGAIPEFTPLLQKASRQGLKVAVSFLNPSMPRALRDAWVLIELAVTIYQFVLASFSLAENHTEVFNILYIVLASIALGLSLIDVMVHCVQLGSCALCVLYCRSKLSSKSKPKRKNSDPESIQSFCLFGKKWRKRINNSLELVRSVASELIFYPLLICDMFDFVATGSYRRADSGQRINFSLFVVGGFYLILAVYLARMLMIGFSLFSLRRIPPSASHTQRAYVNLAIKFGAHILGQMALSVVIIAAIGMKIRQENSAPCSDGSCVTASGFLIYAIISGGIVPLLGIFSFFFTHYYKIRVMSVSLLVDMVSMLQSESFTSVVFAKEGIKKAKTMARNLVEKVQLIEIRKQLKGVIQSMPSWAKILYPLRFPGFWVFGIVYALLLASFVVTLFLSDDGTVEVSNELASFIIAGVFLVIVNIHILLLASVIVAILAVILLLVLLSPALLVLAAIFYLPVGCFFGCMYYCHDLAEETGVFSSPSAHKTRIQNAIQQTRQELHK